MLQGLHLQRCTAALAAQTLDSADYILLATKIISLKLGEQVSNEIKEIYNAFVYYDYDKAMSIISTILPSISTNDQALCDLLQEKQISSREHDKPEKNQTRRYFDTKLSLEIWQSQKKEQFESIDKLAAHINATKTENEVVATPERLPEEIASHYIPYKKDQANEAYDMAEEVIQQIRLHGDSMTGNQMSGLREITGGVYLTKDRDKKQLSDVPPEHKDYKEGAIYSLNTGIVKSIFPMPAEDRLRDNEQAIKNRMPDTFIIDETQANGYSKTNTSTPFVNSVSGTTFCLVATLIQYTKEHKSDLSFESDINNIVNAFLAFTCKSGYHSLGEMFVVFGDAKVKEFFEQNKIKPYALPEIPVSKAIQAATQYSAQINLQKIINTEITQEASLRQQRK